MGVCATAGVWWSKCICLQGAGARVHSARTGWWWCVDPDFTTLEIKLSLSLFVFTLILLQRFHKGRDTNSPFPGSSGPSQCTESRSQRVLPTMSCAVLTSCWEECSLLRPHRRFPAVERTVQLICVVTIYDMSKRSLWRCLFWYFLSSFHY